MSEQIKIEKGVPMPVTTHKSKYPWKAMELGDSFVLDKPRNLASALCSQTSKRYPPMKFKAFKENGSETRSRIFRVE